MASLECPTCESQEKEWQCIINALTKDNKIELLVQSIGFDLIDCRLYNETTGVINKIYILTVAKLNSTNRQDLILRINNPHKFWKTKRNTSEVAIQKYIKEKYPSIPVANILSCSNDRQTSMLGCDIF